MSAGTNTRLGVLLMVATTMIFALQDGLSLHLSSTYNVYMVVMVRYWFFAAFVMTVSAKQAGGLRNAARTKQPALQAFRGVLLAAEICVMVTGFTLLGMVEAWQFSQPIRSSSQRSRAPFSAKRSVGGVGSRLPWDFAGFW